MATPTRSYYDYNPSKPLAGVVAGLYALSFCITLYQILRKKAWVWFVMLFALAMEVVGYIVRIISADHVTEKLLYVIQYVFVILPPVYMTGVIYVIFGRIVFWVVPPESRTIRLLWVPPRFITPIFVGTDIVSLMLQLVAAVLISGTDPTEANAQKRIDIGRALGLVGVSTQIIGFGIFSISAVRFHFSSRRLSEDFANMNKEKHGVTKDWKKLLLVVNASCLLILIRSIYREIEFASGKNGKVHRKEWYLYVFDTLPILLVVFTYNIWFPGNYLSQLVFRVPKEDVPNEETGNAQKGGVVAMEVQNPDKQTREENLPITH